MFVQHDYMYKVSLIYLIFRLKGEKKNEIKKSHKSWWAEILPDNVDGRGKKVWREGEGKKDKGNE